MRIFTVLVGFIIAACFQIELLCMLQRIEQLSLTHLLYELVYVGALFGFGMGIAYYFYKHKIYIFIIVFVFLYGWGYYRYKTEFKAYYNCTLYRFNMHYCYYFVLCLEPLFIECCFIKKI